jgi:hypothetical protein
MPWRKWASAQRMRAAPASPPTLLASLRCAHLSCALLSSSRVAPREAGEDARRMWSYACVYIALCRAAACAPSQFRACGGVRESREGMEIKGDGM